MHQQKSPVQTQPSIPSMRLAYAPDGTAIYKHVTPTAAPPPPHPISTSAPTTAPPPTSSPLFQPSPTATGPHSTTTPPSTDPSQAVPAHGPVFNANTGSGTEPVKKKRGRPRKYGPDGSMALALVPGGATSAGGGLTPPGFASSPGGVPGSGDGVKKPKGGRPPGSSKKVQMAALGSAGIGFTPHVITVKAGEDVSAKIMAFSQNGPRAICILSANGAISNVTLRQAATSGGSVTYEGRFEILSLSGSFLLSETGGQRSRTGGLSVSLAGPDGRVLGGGVAGLLTAASPVQVVVGSFIADGKKEKKTVIHPDPLSAPNKMGHMPVMATGGSSSPSRGTLSESSGGPTSPPNQSAGPFSNNNQHGFSNFPWK
ncbi:putative lysozyme-like protein [Carex littledalei]|uniref:AT-hook motif nuclear-localized protein n=1 Tax=Carex littledalei TaxID=544730 RepID=A0A833VGR6_9POAL|nr:putative lysozyme-like protein [Carex littledalei]